MKDTSETVIAFILAFGTIVALVFGLDAIVWALYNNLVPIFWSEAPYVTFWQMCGIMLLFQLAFGGIRFGGK